MRRPGYGRWIAAILLALAIIAAAVAVARGWIGLHSIRAVEARLDPVIAHHPVTAVALAFLLCTAAFALSFPVAPLVGLAAGALFGFWPAVLIVWPAQVAGSTLSFLGVRRWFSGLVSRRLAKRIAALDALLAKGGVAALLSVRFNPLIPYWPVNLALGATDLPLGRFVAITGVGLLPAMLVYAAAGTRLATLTSLGDVVSPALIGWMLLASLLPVAAQRVVRSGLRRRARGGESGDEIGHRGP